MVAATHIKLAGREWPIAFEPTRRGRQEGGERAFERRLRPAQASDPARIRQATWKLSGPIGQTKQRADGFLGLDWCMNLDTYYDDLVTASPKRITVLLDPATSETGPVPRLPFDLGARRLPDSGSGDDTTHIIEHGTDIYLARGTRLTRISPADLIVERTQTVAGTIVGMTRWLGRLRLGYGSSAVAQSSQPLNADGDTPMEDSTKYLGPMAVGPDRCWAVDASTAVPVDQRNRIVYTLDDFAAFSGAFPVGDPGVPATGMHTLDHFAVVGSQVGAFSFTTDGEPVRVMESVKDLRSAENARDGAAQFGWLYLISEAGLRGVLPGEGRENAVGPGSIRDFRSPLRGRPVAVSETLGFIWLAVEDDEGGTWILRGRFNEEHTGANGLPDWYVHQHLPATRVRAIASVVRAQRPTLLIGSVGELYAYELSPDDNDIEEPYYRYQRGAGALHLSELTEADAMINYLRALRFHTRGCDDTNTWRAYGSFDGAAAVPIGPEITADGLQTVHPGAAGAAFSFFKPELRARITNEESPPMLVGRLTATWDERPQQVVEARVALRIGVGGRSTALADMAVLESLAHERTPIAVQLPGERSDRYGHVTNVAARDVDGDAVLEAVVDLTVWGD